MFDTQIQVGKKTPPRFILSLSVKHISGCASTCASVSQIDIYYSDPPTQTARSPAVLRGDEMRPRVERGGKLFVSADATSSPSDTQRLHTSLSAGDTRREHLLGFKLNLHKYVSQGFSSPILMRPKSSVEKSRHPTVTSPDARISVDILRLNV